jgi:CspA family cold shock protein
VPQRRYSKWFNAEKGFGFIEQDGCGPDVFAHYSNIASSGFRERQEGLKVNFDVTQGQKGPRRRTSSPPDVRLFSRRRHVIGARPVKSPAGSLLPSGLFCGADLHGRRVVRVSGHSLLADS